MKLDPQFNKYQFNQMQLNPQADKEGNISVLPIAIESLVGQVRIILSLTNCSWILSLTNKNNAQLNKLQLHPQFDKGSNSSVLPNAVESSVWQGKLHPQITKCKRILSLTKKVESLTSMSPFKSPSTRVEEETKKRSYKKWN